MIKRTKLEIYAYTYYGTMTSFAYFIGISPVTLWKWIIKRARPSRKNAEHIEHMTAGAITAAYLRDNMD